ncbi:MAG TPA: 16S rRNA (uracil(1498)-N(3))-methyltransferase [Mycobacteriales bacterium]|nr:16S rRNA (uracil(1498)-N(3))-methyltransferase [Mycobacteriales bacterium]
MTPPVFECAEAATADVVVLGGAEGRHAADVRRLRTGEQVDLVDGAGVLARGVVAAVRRGELTVEVRERIRVPRPSPRLVAVQALAKGGRDEDAVESMTEVGVDEVLGWTAARSVARWTDRTLARWIATSRAAAKQSRRAWWPQVAGPVSTPEVAERCASAALAVVLHESASDPLSDRDFPSSGEVVVVIGPEGGLTDEELEVLSSTGAQRVRLGAEVLRSSTAGVAALSVVCSRTRWS